MRIDLAGKQVGIFFGGACLRFPSGGTRTIERAAWGRAARIWEDYMETLFVTESRELLFMGTGDIDVRPLHSSVLHYEGDSREEALRAAHEAAAASKVEACQRGFARWVATVSEITLDGESLTAANRRRWQNAVGYVSQHVFLLDGTLLENIALGEEEEKIDRRRAEESLRAARLEDFVQSLSAGIDTPIGEAGNKLSGGQRQRIGIARALYKQANILFFDEATSALDSGTEEGINRSIAELSQHNRDLTIVVIAHRESSLEYCDRIITLDNNG